MLARTVVFTASVRLLAVAKQSSLIDASRMTAASVARSILDGTRLDVGLANLSEPERVACWRFAVLERTGFSEEESALLAIRTDVDLHEATDLILRGCPRQTALRILV